MSQLMLFIMRNIALAAPAGFRRQRGATLIEYVLIVAVIAIAVFGAAAGFGLDDAISGIFNNASNTINGT